ncbi:MAG TPA: MATE family efflux transporter, partial [Kiloniellales bacterium]|nr:MATE family efflux transporter [Kiloniellales bacterium]
PGTGWHGRVWRLSLPIIVANLTQPLMGMVDSAIMGHQPDPALIGAVAVGALIFSLLYWGFGFLRMGTTGFAAQAFGARQREELAACLARPMLLAMLLGGIIVACQGPIADLAFAMIEPSEAVEAPARLYVEIRIWSAPASLAAYVVVGWLLAVQDTRWVLALSVITNLLNLFFCLFFVLALDWGIAGVAAGTLCAEYATLLISIPVLAWKLGRHGAAPGWARVFEPRRLLALLRVNADLFLRTIALEAVFFTFTTAGARQSDAILAANALLLHLHSLTAYALDGFAHATETLAGAAWGARQRSAFKGAIEASTLWAAIFAILFAIAYAIAGPAILRLFTDHQEIVDVALEYLPWMVVGPLVSIWSYMLDGVFVGATHTGAMRNTMLLSLLVFLGLVWVLLPSAGNHGLWIAFLAFMLARGLSLGALLPGLLRRLPA